MTDSLGHNASNLTLEKFDVVLNTEVGPNQKDEITTITLDKSCNYIIISVNSDFSIGIRIDRISGLFLPLTYGTYEIRCPVKKTIDYKILDNTKFRFSITTISTGINY